MNRRPLQPVFPRGQPPRECGGEPSRVLKYRSVRAALRRADGRRTRSTASDQDQIPQPVKELDRGHPARAGINPRSAAADMAGYGPPREAGINPTTSCRSTRTTRATPRGRGSTRRPSCRSTRTTRPPREGGINLYRCPEWRPLTWPPREGGDQPDDGENRYSLTEATPRGRGSTRSPSDHWRSGEGHPARAGSPRAPGPECSGRAATPRGRGSTQMETIRETLDDRPPRGGRGSTLGGSGTGWPSRGHPARAGMKPVDLAFRRR